MAPSYTQGSWFLQLWIYTTWGCFHRSFSFPGLMVLEKNISKDLLYSFVKLRPPIVAPPYPRGSWFSHFLNLLTTWGCFHTSFSFAWSYGSGEEDFWKFLENFHKFLIISLCKRAWSLIFTTLNLHYLRMLSHKFQLSWPISFWEEDF